MNSPSEQSERHNAIVMCCCGYCGQPADKNGKPLEVIPEGFDLAKAEMVHGMCCAAQQQYETERRTVTRDMAIDAGMLEIEGMQY